MRSNKFIKVAAESSKCPKADAGIRAANSPSETGYALENAADHVLALAMHEKDTSHCASTVSANLAIFEKLQGLWMARAIHVAVRLGLPDLLANRPKGAFRACFGHSY